MRANLLGLAVLTLATFFICACGSTATPIPPQPTLTPVFTDTMAPPTASATVEPTITPSETPLPTPTDQGDCVNRAEFVSDVTIPDDTNFQPGDKFTKTWRIRNIGSCIWNMRYSLVFVKGIQMSEANSAPFPETLPGSTLDASIDMVAPEQGGVFTGSYQIQGPTSDHHFAMTDGNIWVRIVVGNGTATPFTPTATLPTPTPFTAPPASTPTPSPTSTGQSGPCTYLANPDFTSQVITLINQARATNGLPPYTFNNQLAAAAQKHSIDMGCNNFLGHNGSNNSTYKTRIAVEGYKASYSQEAIYAQPPQFGGTPQSAVDWWLNDAQHRPILLNSRLTEIGVGYVSVSTSNLVGYFTVDLATP